MMLTLQRLQSGVDGIFGVLSGGGLVLKTLEHAYDDGHGSWAPKLPAGNYTCVRGWHQLAHSPKPFETFEVVNVPGHSGILFHVGNYNNDSEGCILLGMATCSALPPMLLSSVEAFDKFMAVTAGLNFLSLRVLP